LGIGCARIAAVSADEQGRWMMDNWLNILPIAIILLASMIIFIGDNWRNALIAMGILAFCSFFLYLQLWDILMAGAKLITGWMCVAILFFVTPLQAASAEERLSAKRIFKGMALIMAWMIAYLVSSRINTLFNVSPEIAFTALTLIGCGLLQLGTSSQHFKVVVGILVFFAGFEILFADLESSILVNAMILAVDLLVAFVGAYLITITKTGEDQ
jgi:hypothetical protein